GTRTVVAPEMLPLPAGAGSPDGQPEIAVELPEHVLFAGCEPPEKGSAAGTPGGASPAVQILGGVYVPETITVHLGAPDSDAENITVPFVDYVKNVAANEVYPTWPEEALKANVISQVSIALNRIYTEWYRSRGYDFDITASTAYDQAFVPGSNTYAGTDAIAEEFFNTYVVRPNFVEPLFASFCDGIKTTCNGLSQWGTVSLAEDGRSYKERLGFYFGDIEVAETDDVRAAEGSYPGTPLSVGDEGETVRTVQYQLNRIAINYPRLPLNSNSGVFDVRMSETVSEFQKLFGLPVNGTVDKATWYRISYLYTSVKKLSELSSEGQRPSYNQQLYPGSPLGPSDKGSEVQEMQFYLRRISRFNPLVRPVNIDGIYDADTEESVKSFQRAYRMEVSGLIDEPTWNRIVDVYNGTVVNIEEPILANGLTPYPGTPLTIGSRGEQVEYVQRLLGEISGTFKIVPYTAADGFFGSGTERAADYFAAIFGFPRNGRVDEPLWNEINRVYLAVASNCIFASKESEGRREPPGTTVKEGDSGEDVLYIQRRINVIYTVLPYVGQLSETGEYDRRTKNAVAALQRVFGFTVNGETNPPTWDLLDYITAAAESGCLPKDPLAVSAFAGRKSRAAAAIKALMRENGIKTGAGPVFGLRSRAYLRRWQAEH
ncbi:MAG: peptidoglycan-binding protein, partial [Clostridia bacterium]|nr:peptidoglycan-binding protein [Clostridia bacterium]